MFLSSFATLRSLPRRGMHRIQFVRSSGLFMSGMDEQNRSVVSFASHTPSGSHGAEAGSSCLRHPRLLVLAGCDPWRSKNRLSSCSSQQADGGSSISYLVYLGTCDMTRKKHGGAMTCCLFQLFKGTWRLQVFVKCFPIRMNLKTDLPFISTCGHTILVSSGVATNYIVIVVISYQTLFSFSMVSIATRTWSTLCLQPT